MRIAVVNVSNRLIGGVETYLSTIIPALAANGHQVALWCETSGPRDRKAITMPEGAPFWCVAELGATRALEELRDWRPDVIYAHKFDAPELEARVQRLAPSVFFAHDYYGTCISGSKTFRLPVTTPCHRKFGAACLLHYFPRRCGGLSPVTMVKLYRLQSSRLNLLQRYDAVVTHSEHMLMELLRYGFEAQRVHSFPYYVKPTADELDGALLKSFTSPATESHWHLVFAGRMERLKGAHMVLQSLPQVAAGLDRPLRVTLAGDGRERGRLEREAARLCARHPRLEIVFTGWQTRAQLDALMGQCDLLVFPSLWPEPFGLAGPEACLRGVPVAAFAVGGVTDWLYENINGALAPGAPPTVEGLSAAILRCLRDPEKHARLRLGAVETAQQFSVKKHLASLLVIFDRVTERTAHTATPEEEGTSDGYYVTT
jgi:glycosyltransferase involved in cell wall biosynthesis